METQIVSTVAEFNTTDLKLTGFKAYRIETSIHPIPNYNRRDFYKVCLVTGNSYIQYADKEIVVDGRTCSLATLIFRIHQRWFRVHCLAMPVCLQRSF